MTHERTNQTVFDRLRHSKTARVAVLAAGLALAGCSAGNSSGKAPSSGKASPVAVGARTPGAGSSPTPETGAATPQANWCKAASAIIETAFVDPNTASECTLLPTPSTPGAPFIEWTLNSAGVTGYSVQASELSFPFSDTTSGGHVMTTSSGAKVVLVPQNSELYVDIGDNKTGVLQVLTGQGGAIPLGVGNSLMEAAGVFQAFGEANPYGAQ